VLRPQGVNLHYEVELAVIIGKELKNLDSANTEDAMGAIDGDASRI
jgi:2-keto-4-pentenoate hydratase/2-oxohepta-3-ene-1,7-dioic acid hydratase in catechol pathway